MNVKQYESIETAAGILEYADTMSNIYEETADIYASDTAAAVVYNYSEGVVIRHYESYLQAVGNASRRGYIF